MHANARRRLSGEAQGIMNNNTGKTTFSERKEDYDVPTNPPPLRSKPARRDVDAHMPGLSPPSVRCAGSFKLA